MSVDQALAALQQFLPADGSFTDADAHAFAAIALASGQLPEGTSMSELVSALRAASGTREESSPTGETEPFPALEAELRRLVALSEQPANSSVDLAGIEPAGVGSGSD